MDSQAKQSVIVFFYAVLSSSLKLTRVMAIGSPPITWDRKHTGKLWVYIGTPLPNPFGNTCIAMVLKFQFLKRLELVSGNKYVKPTALLDCKYI